MVELLIEVNLQKIELYFHTVHLTYCMTFSVLGLIYIKCIGM